MLFEGEFVNVQRLVKYDEEEILNIGLALGE